MTGQTTCALTNKDGFTDDDVAARMTSLQGQAPAYDHLIMSVRERYRAGHKQYQISYGPKGGTEERSAIARRLHEAFPSSQIHCAVNPIFTQHLLIVVIFPQT